MISRIVIDVLLVNSGYYLIFSSGLSPLKERMSSQLGLIKVTGNPPSFSPLGFEADILRLQLVHPKENRTVLTLFDPERFRGNTDAWQENSAGCSI